MKSIKNHLMFILPLMAILLGIEFFLVFDRTTNSYEKSLREGYSMLVIAKKPIELATFKGLNRHIKISQSLKRDSIIKSVVKDIGESSREEIKDALPYFYTLKLDSYLNTVELNNIKRDIEYYKGVKRVETFGESYNDSYRLFSFLQFILQVFILFIGVVSLLLIIKQMEIWKYAHQERMQIMEIFGAPLMLRSGVLFKIALIDAIFSTIFVSSLFLYIKFDWAKNCEINIIIKNQEELFMISDIVMLLASSLIIVVISVYWVVFTTNKGIDK